MDHHVFYTTSSFVYHFRSISESKLELQSGDAQSGSNSMNFLAMWPCNLAYDLEFVHHFVVIGEITLELQSRNAKFESKLVIFFSLVTFKFDRWPWKTIGNLFYATSSIVHHCVAIGKFKLELQSGNAQFGSNSTIFRAAWPWNLMDDLEKQ